MNLYIVRHGESTGNKQELHQDANTPLSDEGKRQAEILSNRFESIEIDTCICSPFVRTKHTAEAIIKNRNIPILYDERIIEAKRPTEIEGKSIHDHDVVKIKNKIAKNSQDPNWYYSDEEKAADIMKRVYEFVKDVEQRQEKNILIVSHGEAIRTMILLFMYRDQATPDMWHHFKNFLWLSNTAITLLRRFEVSSDDQVHGWKLITWNDHAHLG